MKFCYFLFFIFISSINAFAWKGDGTEESPYLIETADDLVEFSEYYGYGADNSLLYFKFMNDIDMKGVSMEQLKSSVVAHIDGNNKKISNLVLEQSSGLFNSLRGGSIKNLEIASGCISGNSQIGAFASVIEDCTMENCVNRATVYSSGNHAQNVGGLVGDANSSAVRDCRNYGYVFAPGSNVTRVGGIAGSADGQFSFEGCYNYGTISGAENVGGIVGLLGSDDSIKECYNYGIVSGTDVVGGIVGHTSIPLITENPLSGVSFCWNGGEVNGTGQMIGGICGVSMDLTYSCNMGEIICGDESEYIGGLAGEGMAAMSCNFGTVDGGTNVGGLVGNVLEIESCFNRGSVSGATNVGGLGGIMEGTSNIIKDSYSSASLQSGNGTHFGVVSYVNTGGFINSNDISGVYWNSDLIESGAPEKIVSNFNLTGLTSSELKNQSIAGFILDTNNINDGYPVISGMDFYTEFTKSEKSKITVSAGENGSVFPSGELFLSLGGSVSLNIVAEEGYEYTLLVDGVEDYDFEGLFTPSLSEHTLMVEFKEPTSLKNLGKSDTNVYAENGYIHIDATRGEICKVYNLQGMLLDSFVLDDDNTVFDGSDYNSVTLIFVIGSNSFKIMN